MIGSRKDDRTPQLTCRSVPSSDPPWVTLVPGTCSLTAAASSYGSFRMAGNVVLQVHLANCAYGYWIWLTMYSYKLLCI